MTETLPTKDTKEDTKTAIAVDDRGQMNYSISASEGMVEIELPALPGSANTTERLHAVDFGPHVAGAVERSMTRNPYLKSGPQQNPAATFAHYVGAAKGSGLLDKGSLDYLERLSEEFVSAPDQGEFFKQKVRPALVGLTPKRR